MSHSRPEELKNEMANETTSLRRIDITLRSEQSFPVPYSDGYSVYSALLGVLDDVDPNVSTRVHDSGLGSVHCSGLLGAFQDSDRQYHKSVRSGEAYQLKLGLVDPAYAGIFQALVNAVVLEGHSLELSHGSLRVESFESENTTHEELLSRADACDDPTLGMRFETPTCIEEVEDVTTMFPHRVAVFNSLLGKWNRSCPDDLEVDVSSNTLLSSVIEKPDAETYRTHSVLVSRGERDDGKNRNIFQQGFTGECAYTFKDATESTENAVTALALSAEFSGVGSAVARGCGHVEVRLL